MRLEEIVRASRERGASDVHLAPGEAPALRIDGQLHHRPEPTVTTDEMEALVVSCMDERLQRQLHNEGSCDVVLRRSDLGTVRLHVFKTVRGMHCSVRIFPPSVPALETLDLPAVVEELTARTAGLVLVVGPSGCGKTTLLASMIDRLNETRARNVIAVEDPIEYLHHPKKSVISQCEVGRDTPDFPTAIYGALRADPDVIVIGEARDLDSLKSALLAAETGHLVLASLHTQDAPQALERVVDSFPVDGRDQVRVQLAQALAGVIALRLVARATGNGRRAVAETLIATDAVRNLLREGKTHQLRSVMQTGRNVGMQTLEMHLVELVRRRQITHAVALASAIRPAELDFSTAIVA